MKKIKVGFVGLRRGRSLASDMLGLPNAEIGAICELDRARLDETVEWLKKENRLDGVLVTESFEELLSSDVDAVVIATAATVHTPMAIQALEAGKHVLSEIPAVNSIDEAYVLADVVRKFPKQKYMMAENCCFWAFINTWKGLYEDGAIGKVWYAEAEYLHNVSDLMVDRDGRPTWRASYDAIKYLTHDLGPLLYLLNDRVTEVSGFAPSFNSLPDLSTGTPNEVAIFRTEKGALIKILVCFGVIRPCIHNYCLYGDRGTLETDRMDAYATNACLSSIKSMGEKMFRLPTETGYPGYAAGGHGGADAKMMEAFIDCIVNDTKPPIDVELGLNMSIPGILAHESMKQGGRVIPIPRF
ncbi:MAG: Gfo/Idh/MocA family oxidoreductase [Eubacteriales bacterium]|nr:Gfo/Idh/MocA family oxidoreductase [Eubacteriales bacterium]